MRAGHGLHDLQHLWGRQPGQGRTQVLPDGHQAVPPVHVWAWVLLRLQRGEDGGERGMGM